MSVREAVGPEAGSSDVERRKGGAPRVHFEALVEIGEGKGGGFEAESVDVSPEGMRLRTAYLPDVGEKLVCRFDAPGSELVVEGEVLWRNEEPRGGEFGVRFVGLDAAVAESLRAMCAPAPSAEGGEAAPDGAPRGARVRLHIEGLGSPMKARVRDAASEHVEVGSNLEFLRVGRALELEDVEGGSKREAYVDCVGVEIDPETNVPQLVVSLRYDGKAASAAARPSSKPAPRASSPSRSSEAAGSKDEASTTDEAAVDDEAEAPSKAVAQAADKLKGAGARAAGATAAAAKKLAPALASVGTRGKRAFASLVERVQKKKAERGEANAGAARRMTAPPPGGALKADGRRIVREDDEPAADSAAAPAARSPKRAALVGSAIGLVMVLSLFGVSRAMGLGHKAAATPEAEVAALPSANASAAAAPALPPPAASGVISANVPLFGATPLSTTEAVPVPAPSGSAAAAPPGGDLAAADDKPGAADEEEPGMADDAPAKKEWGTGDVHHPIVLKLKMDGAIDGVKGSSGPSGFTVTVPGRRALSTSSELARKDKRLSAVNVVNTENGAEITVQFKDDVPAYLAKAKGDRLEIELGRAESDRKVASRTKKKHAKSHHESTKAKPKAKKKKH